MNDLPIDKITDALGKPVSHPAVQDLLACFGRHRLPSLRPDDPYADLALKKSGIEFNFADEHHLEGRDVKRYGDAEMVLYAVTLYTREGEPGFVQYPGELPGGGRMGDALPAHEARLGPPTETLEDEDGNLLSRSWHLAPHWLSFAYHRNGRLRFASLISDAYMRLIGRGSA